MWSQTYDPFQHAAISTVVASLPVVLMLAGLAVAVWVHRTRHAKDYHVFIRCVADATVSYLFRLLLPSVVAVLSADVPHAEAQHEIPGHADH